MEEPESQMELVTRLLSIPEAAEVLNVPEKWLREMVTARRVPFTRLGKHVRFSQAHLDEIVLAGQRPAVNAPYSGSRFG